MDFETLEKLNNLHTKINILQKIVDNNKNKSYADSGENPLRPLFLNPHLFDVDFIDRLRSILTDNIQKELTRLKKEFEKL